VNLYYRQRLGEFIEWELDADWGYRLARKWPCSWLGHLPVLDHCGLVEHDYCAACGESVPGMGRRK